MSYDFVPLFRTAVGFDRLARLADSLPQESTTYPPYNIEKTGEDAYRVTLAVAGFGPDDIELTVKENELLVTGKLAGDTSAPQKAEFLHRGIAARAFTRRFALADHIVVEGAELVNGFLHVSVRREVPDSAKPRRVAINTATPAKQLPQAA